MLRLTAAEVESGTRGTVVHGSRDTLFSNVSIDTRNLQGNDIFFAIRGPNQDGHRFIPDALAKGALGAVTEQGYQFPGDFPGGRVLITVRNTHEALKDLAITVRRRWPGTRRCRCSSSRPPGPRRGGTASRSRTSAPTPAPSRASRGCSRSPTAASCSSTRSATSTRRCSPSC